MTEAMLGFIGLGNMGGPMAVNLAAAGNALICYDASGTAERAPDGAQHASSAAEVAEKAAIVFLCLPDGPIANKVAGELMAAPARIVEVVVDNTTSGAGEARATHDMLAEAGIAPYPNGLPVPHRLAQVLEAGGDRPHEELQEDERVFTVAGRLRFKNEMGLGIACWAFGQPW